MEGENKAMKIGIIRCDARSADCAGWNCFKAIENKTGEFSRYDKIELVGFDTCGGCSQGKADKIVKKAKRLKEKGAEAIHLCNYLVNRCPSKEVYIKALQKRAGIPIVNQTHGSATPEQRAAFRAAKEARKAKRAKARNKTVKTAE
jgi:predicted metal-binding protein